MPMGRGPAAASSICSRAILSQRLFLDHVDLILKTSVVLEASHIVSDDRKGICHRRVGEGSEPLRELGVTGAGLTSDLLGVFSLLGLVFIAWYTRVPDNLLSWTYVKSPEHLQELVAKSSAEGKPVVVDFWGDWCTNCKVYDKRIAAEPELRHLRIRFFT